MSVATSLAQTTALYGTRVTLTLRALYNQTLQDIWERERVLHEEELAELAQQRHKAAQRKMDQEARRREAEIQDKARKERQMVLAMQVCQEKIFQTIRPYPKERGDGGSWWAAKSRPVCFCLLINGNLCPRAERAGVQVLR